MAADEMDETYAAHDLSEKALGGRPIRAQDGRFVDGHGRTLSLRGLNVSGASKLPTEPNGLSHLTEGFYERHRTVTFRGRPFPLAEAPLHFRRLQAWGLSLVRLLVTWESLGHAGPNPATDLDGDYIEYLRDLIALMPEYGLKCFVCGHQDVWSRFSGGSGAPGWTFEAAGLDIAAFTETGAAYIHGQDEARRKREFLENGGRVDPREPSGPFVWPSGYQKLAASTMATLFWAGDALAPKVVCRRTAISSSSSSAGGEKNKNTQKEEVVSVQTFLQEAFIEAFGRLADAVGGLEACVGFDPMNEPHRGLVNLHGFHAWDYNTDLHIGHCPSLAQSLALGSGYAQDVPFYVRSWPHPTRKSHDSVVDPQGRSVWLSKTTGAEKEEKEGVDRPRGLGQCVWLSHGVWSWDEKRKKAVIHDDDYFERDHRPGREGERLEWYRDCWAPFLLKFSERVSRTHPQHLSFLEPIPNEFMPPWEGKEEGDDPRENASQKYATKTVVATKRPQNLVYAPHFYDLNVLFSKAHGLMSVNVQGLSRGMFVLKALYFGETGLRANYRKQLGNILNHGRRSLGKAVPALIGEVGISFDINGRHAFATGDYDMQRQLMHGLVSAMEDCRVAFTLWNYNPDNRVAYGDGWNKEDFSVVNGDHHDGDNNVPPPDYRNRAHEGDELYRGGRVLDVIIRPYAAKVAGTPVRSEWDHRTLRFSAVWRTSPSTTSSATSSTAQSSGKDNKKARQTEIFLPAYHYAAHELDVATSHGLEWTLDRARQTLYVRSTHRDAEAYAAAGLHYVIVEIRDVPRRLRERVRERRAAGFSNGVLRRLPLDVEVWVEERMSFGQGAAVGLLLLGVLGALLGFVLGMM